jgi:hypothetical protein
MLNKQEHVALFPAVTLEVSNFLEKLDRLSKIQFYDLVTCLTCTAPLLRDAKCFQH